MIATRKDIITLPHKNLRRSSQKVSVVTQDIRRLVADMQAATLDWEDHRQHETGVALAAVQLNQLLRIVVVRNNLNDKRDRTFTVFINPEVAKYEGAVKDDYEGCLSIKDIYGKVPRYEKVRIKALDINGRPLRVTAEGFLARVFQHEIDHTKGTVFIDHIRDEPEAFFRLNSEGHLTPIDYEKEIKDNRILWQ